MKRWKKAVPYRIPDLLVRAEVVDCWSEEMAEYPSEYFRSTDHQFQDCLKIVVSVAPPDDVGTLAVEVEVVVFCSVRSAR